MADLADVVLADDPDGSTPTLWGDARLRCILGATAEGIAEYGSATILERVRDVVFDLDEPEPHRVAFAGSLEMLLGTRRVDPTSLAPHASLGAVIERFLGTGAQLTLIDAACASSLYAIELGMRELRDGDADLIIVGGVFAPGAELHPLFARMQMLSRTGCFPFDARADGIVFGEGAAMLALERLGDALATGHRNHAVIRGAGLSSDGRSAAVNVPRAAGQALALERAYSSAGVDRRACSSSRRMHRRRRRRTPRMGDRCPPDDRARRRMVKTCCSAGRSRSCPNFGTTRALPAADERVGPPSIATHLPTAEERSDARR